MGQSPYFLGFSQDGHRRFSAVGSSAGPTGIDPVCDPARSAKRLQQLFASHECSAAVLDKVEMQYRTTAAPGSDT